MLTFNKDGYTYTDIAVLQAILSMGVDRLQTLDCKHNCETCKHKRSCKDVTNLIGDLYHKYLSDKKDGEN